MQNIKRRIKFSKWGISIVSAAGTFGSLYYSAFGDPVRNIKTLQLFNKSNALAPCDLCWYARILMYPILIISVVGIYKKDSEFTNYVAPLAYLGVLLEIYHYSIQMFGVKNIINCSSGVSCSQIDVIYMHFVTIPFLGFVAFVVILFLCVYSKYLNFAQESNKI